VRKKLSILNFQFSISKGFTLVELIVVFSVVAIITSAGLASFAAYGNQQSLQIAGADVLSFLQTARSRAISQIKPSSCAAATLDSYDVTFTVPGSDYALNAVCDGAEFPIGTKTLPSKLQFKSGSDTKISFQVLDGTANNSTVTIINRSGGISKVITVDNIGNIKIASQ